MWYNILLNVNGPKVRFMKVFYIEKGSVETKWDFINYSGTKTAWFSKKNKDYEH